MAKEPGEPQELKVEDLNEEELGRKIDGLTFEIDLEDSIATDYSIDISDGPRGGGKLTPEEKKDTEERLAEVDKQILAMQKEREKVEEEYQKRTGKDYHKTQEELLKNMTDAELCEKIVELHGDMYAKGTTGEKQAPIFVRFPKLMEELEKRPNFSGENEENLYKWLKRNKIVHDSFHRGTNSIYHMARNTPFYKKHLRELREGKKDRIQEKPGRILGYQESKRAQEEYDEDNG